MNNLNSILIEGNIVRDPECRTTPKGTAVCTFSIASNRFYHEGDALETEVGFFDIEAWGKLATQVSGYGHKGQGVRVIGRLKQDRWQDTEGKQHSRIVVVGEHVEIQPERSTEPAREPDIEIIER